MRQYKRRFRDAIMSWILVTFNNAVYANYMQETAIDASAEAG